MLQLSTLISFVSASVVLAFIPGPDNLFVLTQSALRGWRVGIAVTAGLCTGLLVHTAAVALGIAVVFQRSEVAFTALKIVGAAYLVYLAFGAWRAGPSKISSSRAEPERYGRMYLRGIVMNVTNPKVAIFFLAFLPQFTSSQSGPVALQVVSLGAIFIACAFMSFSAISCFAGVISQKLMRSDRAQVIVKKIAAFVFVGLAARLAVAHR